MCTVVSSGPCQCSGGLNAPTAFIVLAKLFEWAYTVLGVFLWWLTGPAILPRARRRGRRYARYVHATGRITFTVVMVAAIAWPVTTGLTLLGLGLAATTAATLNRDRIRRRHQLDAGAPRPAIRIRATVRQVTRAGHHG